MCKLGCFFFLKQKYSLAELDEKINALKQALLRKTNDAKSKEVDELL